VLRAFHGRRQGRASGVSLQRGGPAERCTGFLAVALACYRRMIEAIDDTRSVIYSRMFSARNRPVVLVTRDFGRNWWRKRTCYRLSGAYIDWAFYDAVA
jgi:hypothetical protein